MFKLVIGVDVDGVLVDLITQLARFHNHSYGTNLSKADFRRYDLRETLGGTGEEVAAKMAEFYRSQFFGEILPTPGAVVAIKVLSQLYELHVITSRLIKLKYATEMMLKKHFAGCFTRIHFTAHPLGTSNNDFLSKAEVAVELGVDVMIEDEWTTALACAKTGIYTLLFDADWNDEFSTEGIPNLDRVFTWANVLGRIKGWEERYGHMG